MHFVPALLLTFVMTYSYYYGHTPLLLSLVFVIASIITYLMYAKDKSAAEKNTWRTPENTLHIHSLLCGWPGAIIAQKRLRHKTKKVSFRIAFWLTVTVNIAVVGWLHTDSGNKILYRNVSTLETLLLNNVTDTTVSNAIKFILGFNRKMGVSSN